MLHVAPLKRHKDSSKDWNVWITICAIIFAIGVIVAIEFHIRGLMNHSALP